MDEVGNTFNTKRFVTMYKPVPKFVPAIQFRVDKKIIPQIGTFRNLNLKSSGSISVDISKKNIYVKMMKYLYKHAEAATSSEDEVKAWDANFINKLDPDTHSNLYYEANLWEIKGLVDLTGQAISDRKNKTPEALRNTVNTNREEEDDEPNVYIMEAFGI